ncbi:hypothetical protein Suden_1843 [Sulfurimonas denitrificans DSM 1251]|uniref:DUF2780 domain-containing protein n=1 Tax=Sulfurimonas denitrificans (strain ATCC 33889 / DSM 1251) TaxID=326298 RepID=Q30PG4_SULDN|nr:DUF2780 domain-containing protein [Sulfurimonas denitrificans]ABB45117.1 hypothetical protein Suden_1843 [Sulfurimonas denitrificans DSM 1251]MDD3442816.1 DUF2780 domain-containing protein [Sulfurimonas denitrificans]
MKKRPAIALLSAALLSTQLSAFDMGSMMKAATPLLSGTPATTKTTKEDNALLSSLSALGVTKTQAAGGAAALLSGAKDKMEPSEFQALTKQAPALGNIMNSTSAAASLLGATSPESQFSALGIDASMIAPFKDTIISYAKEYVSPEIITALVGALEL